MGHLRIATVQLEYLPLYRTAFGNPWYEEPLMPSMPYEDIKEEQESNLLISLLQNSNLPDRTVKVAISNAREAYLQNIKLKIEEILSYCSSNNVDLVVFPEYSIPPEALEVVHQYSINMVIVGGIGIINKNAMNELNKEEYELDLRNVKRDTNAAVLFSPNQNEIITKEHPSQGEDIAVGTGPKTFKINTPKGIFSIGVAICLDFEYSKETLLDDRPDIVAIPSLTRSTEPFIEKPREFSRIFANHAALGNSYIGVADMKGLHYFKNKDGSIPVPPQAEAIVIVDWNLDKPYQDQPTSPISTDHLPYAMATILYKGFDSKVTNRLEPISNLPSEEALRLSALEETHTELKPILDKEIPRYSVLSRLLSQLDSIPDHLPEREIRVISRHLALSPEVLRLTEWKYKQCQDFIKSLTRSNVGREDWGSIGPVVGVYGKSASDISREVRSSLLEDKDKAEATEHKVDLAEENQLVFFATLGYSELPDSVELFVRQLNLIRTLADLNDPELLLRYRLSSFRDSSQIMHASFQIYCMTKNKTEDELESLRGGIGQLIHVTFGGSYSLTYTTNDLELDEPW